MQSKNKRQMTQAEREHVGRIKEMPCGLCGAAGPSDAHELQQEYWFTSIPLCRDCHMGQFNGIHGQKRMWSVLKETELSVLDKTIGALVR
jgi:hypothetical protein